MIDSQSANWRMSKLYTFFSSSLTLRIYTKSLGKYHVRYLSHLALIVGSCNWVYKTQIHSIERWRHFGAKTKPIHLDGSNPLITGSSILDPDQLSFCTIYTCQLDEIHYLETRSHCVNMSFIIQAFLVKAGMSYWRERLSTVDIFVQTSYFLYWKYHLPSYKRSYLIRRSTVLSLLPQLVFPDLAQHLRLRSSGKVRVQ